jgi:uncharacterized protein YndB with AHSA1/START domain
MNEYGERLDKSTVRFERLLPGPVERVWEYITNGEKRAKWLAGGNTELAVDGHIELHFHNASLSPLPDDQPPPKYCGYAEKTSYSGRVTRCDPPHLLAHTWVSGDSYSEVEYQLSEKNGKVLLVLTHTRLGDDDELLGVCGGWHAHFAILIDHLEGRTPRPFWKTHTALEAEYVSRLDLN